MTPNSISFTAPSRRLMLTGLAGTGAVAVWPPSSAAGSATQLDENKAVIRRLLDGVQRDGDFVLFDQLFAADYVDHTPFGDFPPDREGTRSIYQGFRTAFPDWRAVVHAQIAEGDLVTTRKTYYGTHLGDFHGIAPTGRETRFEVIDIMRVRDGRITDHWGFGDGAGLLRQIS